MDFHQIGAMEVPSKATQHHNRIQPTVNLLLKIMAFVLWFSQYSEMKWMESPDIDAKYWVFALPGIFVIVKLNLDLFTYFWLFVSEAGSQMPSIQIIFFYYSHLNSSSNDNFPSFNWFSWIPWKDQQKKSSRLNTLNMSVASKQVQCKQTNGMKYGIKCFISLYPFFSRLSPYLSTSNQVKEMKFSNIRIHIQVLSLLIMNLLIWPCWWEPYHNTWLKVIKPKYLSLGIFNGSSWSDEKHLYSSSMTSSMNDATDVGLLKVCQHESNRPL